MTIPSPPVPPPPAAYLDMLRQLYHLQVRTDTTVLQRLRRELDLLAPEWRGIRVVHVTGTSGKGSTASFLAAMLATQYRVGLLTSPHIFSFTERLCCNGRAVSYEELVQLWSLLKQRLDPEQLSFQEAILLLAMMFFTRQQVSIAILEVGRGGRRDPTAVLAGECTILTNVGRDHIPTLGPNLEAIAREKAGIATRGTLLTAEQQTRDILLQSCQEQGVRLIDCPAPAQVLAPYNLGTPPTEFCPEHCHDLVWQGNRKIIRPTLFPVQRSNMALAVLAAEQLGINATNIGPALQNTFLPARLEIFQEAIVDIAHNASSLQALLHFFASVRPVLLMGIASSKDVPAMLACLPSCVSHVVFTRAYRGSDPQFLQDNLPPRVPSEQICPPTAALARAHQLARQQKRLLLVTGSTFLIDALFNPQDAEQRLNQE